MSNLATADSNQTLELEKSVVPVTALLSLKNSNLLAGEGFVLCIYHSKTGQLVLSRQVFQFQIIHGFCLIVSVDSHDEVLIWGGHWIRIARLYKSGDSGVVEVQLKNPIRCPDWILDVCSKSHDLSTYDDSLNVIAYAVTAHDELLEINGHNQINSINPGSGSLLFSAHMVMIDPNRVLVASGTAFGQIIVWTCTFDGVSEIVRIHHVFSGHEGSVFGVQISDEITIASDGSKLRILASCSDDRTIRAWDISNLSFEISQDQQVTTTGFTSQSSKCLASVMGHESRIWQLRYVHIEPNESRIARILSTGEDASVQCWDLNGSLKPSSSFTNHSGKNIWSVDISKGSPLEEQVVFTGGADGRISSISVFDTDPSRNHWAEARSQYQISISGKADQNTIQQGNDDFIQTPKGHIRSVALTTGNNALITAELGEVLLCNLRTRQCKQLGKFDQLARYSIMCSTPSGDLVFIGGPLGDLFVYHHGTEQVHWVWRDENSQRKIAQLWAEKVSTTQINVVLSQLGEKHTKIIQFNQNSSGTIQITRYWQVLTLGNFTTSYSQVIYGNQVLVSLGSRKGSISIYSLNALGDGREDISPSLTLPNAHGTDTVTYLCWLDYDREEANVEYLASVGRDGLFSIFRIQHGLRYAAECIHKLSLPFGPNLEGLWFSSTSHTFVVYGFHGNRFVAYNVTTAQPILVLPCGGAHRTWAFSPNTGNGPKDIGGRFVWVQASQLKSFAAVKPSWSILKDGAHGRDIKACAISPAFGNSPQRLFATGAEDTNIAVFRWSQETGDMKILSRIRRHETGIQCLKWSDDAKYLFSSGGVEEFFVWRIQPCPGLEVGVVCVAQLPVDVARSDLRITSFAVRRPTGEDELYFITLSYSNSVLKTYLYNASNEEDKWILISSRITPTFLTSISYIENKYLSCIVTSTNDGYLSVWSYQQDKSPPYQSLEIPEHTLLAFRRVHQSSIRCCSVIKAVGERYLVLTGGDDNAVALSLIRPDFLHNSNSQPITTTLIPNAHAAAITACVITPQATEAPHNFIALTCSTDQTVRKWDFWVDFEGGSIDMLPGRIWSARTAIADVSDMDFHLVDNNKARVLLCGAGLETWALDMNSTKPVRLTEASLQ